MKLQELIARLNSDDKVIKFSRGLCFVQDIGCNTIPVSITYDNLDQLAEKIEKKYYPPESARKWYFTCRKIKTGKYEIGQIPDEKTRSEATLYITICENLHTGIYDNYHLIEYDPFHILYNVV